MGINEAATLSIPRKCQYRHLVEPELKPVSPSGSIRIHYLLCVYQEGGDPEDPGNEVDPVFLPV